MKSVVSMKPPKKQPAVSGKIRIGNIMGGKHRFRRRFPLFCVDGYLRLYNTASLPVQRENECEFAVFVGKMKVFV